MIIINRIEYKFQVAKRLDLNFSHHKKEILCGMIEVPNSTMVEIIYLNVSNQHIVSFKITQCYFIIT